MKITDTPRWRLKFLEKKKLDKHCIKKRHTSTRTYLLSGIEQYKKVYKELKYLEVTPWTLMISSLLALHETHSVEKSSDIFVNFGKIKWYDKKSRKFQVIGGIVTNEFGNHELINTFEYFVSNVTLKWS